MKELLAAAEAVDQAEDAAHGSKRGDELPEESFEQSYNCQALVASETQVILAEQVTQQANDKQQVKPLIEPYVAPGRQKRSAPPALLVEALAAGATIQERMAAKTPMGKRAYSRRKETVEPVFGQIKEACGRQARECMCAGVRGVAIHCIHIEKLRHVYPVGHTYLLRRAR